MKKESVSRRKCQGTVSLCKPREHKSGVIYENGAVAKFLGSPPRPSQPAIYFSLFCFFVPLGEDFLRFSSAGLEAKSWKTQLGSISSSSLRMFFFSYTCVGARPLGSDPAVLGVRQQAFYREFLKRSSPLRDPAHVFLRKAEEMIGRMALL